MTTKAPYAHTAKNTPFAEKNISAPKKYLTLSNSPKLARVIALNIIGTTEFKDNPSINALIYFGGSIPARPTILEFKIAMHIPKAIIMATEN
jgi:hypothetical protein